MNSKLGQETKTKSEEDSSAAAAAGGGTTTENNNSTTEAAAAAEATTAATTTSSSSASSPAGDTSALSPASSPSSSSAATSPVGNNVNNLGVVDVSGGGDTVTTNNNNSSSSSENNNSSQSPVTATTTNNDAKDESAEPLKIPADQRSGDYKKLIRYGLAEKVAAKLDDIYNTGKLAHSDLDERALDALKEFPVDGALTVLKQFLDSNLEHVSNKSAYLCGVMKTYRQKSRSGQNNAPPVQSPVKGPDESKIKAILERTGYTLDVTTGQRKYGGPPPNWDGLPPGNGCEVFCGKIPKDMYEDEIIPLFEKCGTIWDLRLMMDPMTGLNRGYAFVTFNNREGAQEAVRQLNDFEIRKGKKIGVTISYNNHRLFVGNIPKNRDRDELFEEFSKHAPGLTEVIIYSSPDDRKKNRGFCFLEYESHKAASLAKRRLGTSRVKVWGCDIIVDWADPQEEPDDETMSKVKVLYVRNLTQEVTEEKLKESFETYGRVDRVKKIKDYAFVHFEERDSALKAMEELNSKEIGGSNIEISLAKPPSDKKKKEEILRARERRMMQMMTQRPPSPDAFFRVIPPIQIRGGVRGAMRAGPMGRGDFEYQEGGYENSYGYGLMDYRDNFAEHHPLYEPDFYTYDDLYYDFASSSSPTIVPTSNSSTVQSSRGRNKPLHPATVGRGRGGMVRGRGGVGLEMGPAGVGQMVPGGTHGMVPGGRVQGVGVAGGPTRFGQYPVPIPPPHSRGLGTRLGGRASVPTMGGAHRGAVVVTNGRNKAGISNPGNSLQARE